MKQNLVNRVLTDLCIRLIIIYQKYAPRRIRNACRFEPSCSNFGIQALKRWGIFRGVKLIIKRLSLCKPPYGGTMLVPNTYEEYHRIFQKTNDSNLIQSIDHTNCFSEINEHFIEDQER